jgi:hypothetical protein
MALDATQKAAIRTYLGHPDAYRYKNTRLESILDNLSPEAEVQIGALLESIDAIDTATLAHVDVDGVQRVDEITFHAPGVRLRSGASTMRMLIGRLSIILGVPLFSSFTGGSGYPGDFFL